jgi:hypothetical protein
MNMTEMPGVSRPSSKYAPANGLHSSSISAGSVVVDATPRSDTHVFVFVSLMVT